MIANLQINLLWLEWQTPMNCWAGLKKEIGSWRSMIIFLLMMAHPGNPRRPHLRIRKRRNQVITLKALVWMEFVREAAERTV